MQPDIDIIEFIEKTGDIELLEWQKEYIRRLYNAGPDPKIIFPRHNSRTDYLKLANMIKEVFKEE